MNVAAGNNALVLIAWDDPQLARSFSATSTTGGKGFDAPVRLEAADAVRNDTARRERFIVLPSGKFLRIWQAGDNCVLYQQEADEAAQNWSAPLRVLETLGGCPRGWRVLPLADDQVLLNISLAEAPSGLVLAIWDGNQPTCKVLKVFEHHLELHSANADHPAIVLDPETSVEVFAVTGIARQIQRRNGRVRAR